MKVKILIVGGLLLLLIAGMAAFRPTQTMAQAQPTPVIPNLDAWTKSPHNDAKAMAFTDWNDTKDKSVPVNCARCHSTTGYQDYLGADGSPAGVVDKPAPIGQTIQCVACHNSATATLTSVKFPSGAEITGLGPEARCMECHQGRVSKVDVDKAIEDNGLTATVDKVSDKLGFLNIHYFAAAATLYGSEVHGGYEYDGKSYDAKNDHVANYNTCVACHNSHTTELKVNECSNCHQGIKTKDDLKNIRMAGSAADYNGNGDTKEGIAKEIEGLQGMLYKAIQAYAKEKAGKAIAYNAAAYPYFFFDTNGNGKADDTESKSDNAFKAWTPRLLRAAYNYQTSIKDPGQYAHGGKYIIELLYDSIDDLNASGMTGKVDLSKAHRTDAGHFNGSAEPFRHWDEEGMTVPATCAKCHSATGLPQFLNEAAAASDKVSGIVVAQPASNGLNCATCHDDVSKFTRRQVEQVKFPSGAVVGLENKDANLCLECHQGRESTVSVNAAITKSTLTDDQVATKDKALSFRNPHYFAAGASLMGSEVHGAYEYAKKQYNGRTLHPAPNNSCVACHDVHALTVKVASCAGCHGTKTEEDLANIRKPNDTVDYNGNGDTKEGFAKEIAGMEDKLLVAIQAYAKTKAKSEVVYSAASYPYFFIDTNKNGKPDPDELKSDNSFKNWTPRLLRAAYNYQWVQKDPGQFAHNFYYIDQILFDTLADIGGAAATKGMTRAPYTAPVATTK